jgi:hypothetical protein
MLRLLHDSAWRYDPNPPAKTPEEPEIATVVLDCRLRRFRFLHFRTSSCWQFSYRRVLAHLERAEDPELVVGNAAAEVFANRLEASTSSVSSPMTSPNTSMPRWTRSCAPLRTGEGVQDKRRQRIGTQ